MASGPFLIWVHHLEGRPVVGHPPWEDYVPKGSASDGYASLELELWDPETGLVAYGTQTMIFTFAGPKPEGDDRFPLDVRLENARINNA